jgi:hypothetical protein
MKNWDGGLRVQIQGGVGVAGLEASHGPSVPFFDASVCASSAILFQGAGERSRHGADCLRSESPRGIRVHVVTFEEMEAGLRARMEALPPAARIELLHVLRLPDFDRADRIGEFSGYPESRALPSC